MRERKKEIERSETKPKHASPHKLIYMLLRLPPGYGHGNALTTAQRRREERWVTRKWRERTEEEQRV